MKKILMLTYDNCDDSEVLYPLFRFQEEGWQVTVASMEKRTIKAKYHFTIEATHLFDEINPAEFDALMLPGGTAPEKIRQQMRAIELVRHFTDTKKPIGAICHGQQILISAKALAGIRCTCYPGIRDDLVNAGGLYENSPVVVDKNIVTSRRPEDLPYFMRELVKMIKSK